MDNMEKIILKKIDFANKNNIPLLYQYINTITIESFIYSIKNFIFQMACSDYTVAYYNTHFDFQEYVDQRALYENENFILNSELMSLLFSSDERYNILIKLRQKVINDHAIYRYGTNGTWKVMPEGMRASYA